MTVDTLISIAMWIAGLTITVLLVILACCAIWLAIRPAWEYISQHIDHYAFFNPKPIETEDDKINKRLLECERKIKLLEDFVGATYDYIEQKRKQMLDNPMPIIHYDKEDGCWVLDDCVRVNDILTFSVGKDDIYINYSKKKNEAKDIS